MSGAVFCLPSVTTTGRGRSADRCSTGCIAFVDAAADGGRAARRQRSMLLRMSFHAAPFRAALHEEVRGRVAGGERTRAGRAVEERADAVVDHSSRPPDGAVHMAHWVTNVEQRRVEDLGLVRHRTARPAGIRTCFPTCRGRARRRTDGARGRWRELRRDAIGDRHEGGGRVARVLRRLPSIRCPVRRRGTWRCGTR